jgi:hypothetical protein
LGEWNRELQAGCQRLQAVGKRARLTPEERERLKSAKRLRLLEARTKQFILPELLKQVEIDPASWLIQSPFRIPEDCREHWKPLLSGLFKPKDTIWCGYLEDSGDRLHTTRFKHVEDWMQCTHHPGPQTCPGVFFEVTAHKGERIFSRSKDLVRLRPYWVAESDLLAKAQFGIIIQHLRQQLFLRAIVDTGGKSLHAWFDAPHLYQIGRDKLDPKIERRMEELQSVMCGLGCDPHMFNLNSTTRLPGCLRLDEETGQARGWQRLLYLDPKHEPCTGLT